MNKYLRSSPTGPALHWAGGSLLKSANSWKILVFNNLTWLNQVVRHLLKEREVWD